MTIRCRTCPEKCDSNQLDTELIDTLVAISVVSKRLAEKLNTLSKQEKAREGGNPNGKGQRIITAYRRTEQMW